MTSLMASAPTEIRTPVLGLKGLRPSPLDDGGVQAGWILPFPRQRVNDVALSNFDSCKLVVSGLRRWLIWMNWPRS